jgi:LacI family transcriptional regulator
VPDDVAVIGYDDIDFARSAAVPLSSVRQPSADIGVTAIDLLLTAAESPDAEPRHVVFRPELVARASTGAPSPAT